MCDATNHVLRVRYEVLIYIQEQSKHTADMVSSAMLHEYVRPIHTQTHIIAGRAASRLVLVNQDKLRPGLKG